jgi:hypothetical protein
MRELTVAVPTPVREGPTSASSTIRDSLQKRKVGRSVGEMGTHFRSCDLPHVVPSLLAGT